MRRLYVLLNLEIQEGADDEYNVMYRCKIVGGKKGFIVDTPRTSLLCESDPATCVVGPKQPLYAYQAR